METTSCLTCLQKLIKVWLSEGGGVQFDFLLKGMAFHECCWEEGIVSTSMF